MTRSNAARAGSASDEAVQQLRARGERVTRARLAVLDVLAAATDAREHLAADEIARRASAAAPGVHRATVYRALTTLSDLGILTHTHLAGTATVYHLTPLVPVDADSTTPESQRRTAHAHLQCVNCGSVQDVPLSVLDPVSSTLERDLDFLLDPTHSALLGTCTRCPAAAQSS